VPPLQESFSQSVSSQNRDRSRQPSISSLHHSKPSRGGRVGFARQVSQSGSFFQSENGSNPNLSTPPVPRMRTVSHPYHTKSMSTVAQERGGNTPSDIAQERGGNTPSDYALSVVFHRFVTSAEALIAMFLQKSLDDEPFLPDFLGPGIDKSFDGLLDSLGRIAQRHTNAVIDCITRWRKTQNEPVTLDTLRTNQSVK
jgi:hypothetical protein